MVSLARRHEDITGAGARVVGIGVDSPGQHTAVVDQLHLPFPLLSDPDRSSVITPWGLADPEDLRKIAIPAVVVVAPDGTEAFRFTSRDYADRPTEEHVIDELRRLELPPTGQDPPDPGEILPGPHAMPGDQLLPYYRGARFAAMALSRRHPAIAEDAGVYIATMDRYLEAVKKLHDES